ncbi:helix-turn-helix transcriptional regulator [Bacillus sp. MRMR6]|uniref:helix-turn-helix transcriptional regulator n=1 Tax=Bacillus sp. MRMR6 TaxID=1928617 RepID=UPI000952C7D6|nr:helix-turn-helix transcriptional regulator [Bacillus sp. MRMR6]OLS33747.1 hypothetical protein BTR25_24275 [Bacillus sp. MRMR6]
MKVFGVRIKRLRNEIKMTQKQLAVKLKISESAIGMYERGEREPSFDIIVQLSEIFKVSVDYLLGRTNLIGTEVSDPNYNNLPKAEPVNVNVHSSVIEIIKIVHKYALEDSPILDLEKWKNLSQQDIEDINKYFEYVVHKANERTYVKNS